MTTDQRRWSDTDEAKRLNYIAAGIEPRYYKWWGDTSTDELRKAHDEYVAKREVLNGAIGYVETTELIDQLAWELAYRCTEFTPDKGGAHPWCRDCGWQKRHHAMSADGRGDES